jgi:nitric oxide dioxygenase
MDEPYTFLPQLTAEAAPPKRGIHSQTIAKQESFELVLFAMAPGEQLSEHTSARPAIVHILSGQGELTVAGEQYALDRDAWLYMQAGTPHAIVARSGLVFGLYLLERR